MRESKLDILKRIHRKAEESYLLSHVLPANKYGLAERLADLVEITTEIVQIKNVPPEELDAEIKEKLQRIEDA